MKKFASRAGEAIANFLGLGCSFRKALGNPATADDLIDAIARRKPGVVSEMIERGCEMRGRGKLYDTTALEMAIRNGYLAMAETFIANGAEVNARNEYGVTPLMTAARDQWLEAVKLLVGHGADINAQTPSGGSALFAAMTRDHSPVVEFLVKAGARLDLPDNDGALPLDYAIREEMKNTEKLLKEHGAKAVKGWKPRKKCSGTDFVNGSATFSIIMS